MSTASNLVMSINLHIGHETRVTCHKRTRDDGTQYYLVEIGGSLQHVTVFCEPADFERLWKSLDDTMVELKKNQK